MSTENASPVSQTPNVKVNDELYVNEATIELLQRRIEAKVLSNANVNDATLELFQRRIESKLLSNAIKTIGIPVTGGGIVAVIVAMFFVIPSQVGKVVENDPTIKAQIASSVENYLGKGKGQEFLVHETEVNLRKELPVAIDRQLDAAEVTRLVAQQLPKSIEAYFAAGKGDEVLAKQLPGAVTAYLGGTNGQALLVSRLNVHLQSEETAEIFKSEIAKVTPQAVENYLSQGAGKQKLEDSVRAHVNMAQVEKIIRDSVNLELRKIALNRTNNINSNRTKAVNAIATPKVEKGSVTDIRKFLDSDEARKAGAARLPLAISFEIGIEYVPDVINTYVQTIKQRYARSDIYFVLHEGEGKFRAVCGPIVRDQRELTGLKEPAGREFFVEVVKSAGGDQFQSTISDLEQLIGTVITSHVSVSESLESALRSNVWKNPDQIDEQVAVVTVDRQFIGTTTRGDIISALLEK